MQFKVQPRNNAVQKLVLLAPSSDAISQQKQGAIIRRHQPAARPVVTALAHEAHGGEEFVYCACTDDTLWKCSLGDRTWAAIGAAVKVVLGLGRIVTLHHRSSTAYHIR